MRNIIAIIGLILMMVSGSIRGQAFVHPGIDMNQKDLEYMKKQTLAGQEPWRGAFERMKEKTPLDTQIDPVTHIIQGPYSNPDFGGTALSRNSDLAYNCALIWYITGDEKYAQKALEIYEKWSECAWTFEDNNAKLLAGLACYPFCAGAELLRYHYPGWTEKHTERFASMLMESFFPVLRFYYPEANGNWDAIITRALLSVAVFMDDRSLFDESIHHFLHGTANGSLFKYIFPSGQSQETVRDLVHVQMGLFEFGGAARIAYTQGVDLFSLGNHRLALGIEYTMDVISGGQPHAYGVISTRANQRRDDYEYLYRHYTALGVKMPIFERICNEQRERSHRGVLIAFREVFQNTTAKPTIDLRPGTIAFPAGAAVGLSESVPEFHIEVSPGDNLQEALDNAAGTGRWVVAKAGVHTFKQTLNIPSGTRLIGEGLSTVFKFDSIRYYGVSTNDDNLHDVYISNLVIDGSIGQPLASDPNSGRFTRTGHYGNRWQGIAFLGKTPGSMKNIVLTHVTVNHFSRNGVFITGVDNLVINNCNFSDNGSFIVPGPRLHHNLLLRYVTKCQISNSRFDTSLAGCGIALANCTGAAVQDCEIARNGWFGVLLSTSEHITIEGNLIEGNSASGIMSEYLRTGCSHIDIRNNLIQYNDGYGVEAFQTEKLVLSGNKYELNGRSAQQENISEKSQIILQIN